MWTVNLLSILWQWYSNTSKAKFIAQIALNLPSASFTFLIFASLRHNRMPSCESSFVWIKKIEINLDRTNKTHYLYDVHLSATLKRNETIKNCNEYFMHVRGTLHSHLMGETQHIYSDSLRYTQAFWNDRVNWATFTPTPKEKTELKHTESNLW